MVGVLVVVVVDEVLVVVVAVDEVSVVGVSTGAAGGAGLVESSVVVGTVAVVVAGEVVVVCGAVVVGREAGTSRPLSSSSCWICFSTSAISATAAATSPPSAVSASSFCKAATSRCWSSADGSPVSVTTNCLAIAVVKHAGQLTLSAPAALMGAMTLLRPITSTICTETAMVVQALQLAKAKALFVFVTGCPSLTVMRA